MTLTMALLVSAAGGLGALLRVLVGRSVVRWTGRPHAAGTFVVNISGALALGVLTGAAASTNAALLIGTGLLGGYTTFSTWIVETDQFARHGQVGAAALNLAASSACGLAAVWVGRTLAGG
jgi:CrcB protein